MKVLIVEDEDLAVERLEQLIGQYDAEIEVIAKLDTVAASVQWLQSNPAPDLAFFDIQLADGLSFQIFEKTEVPCPVIFTTAYDQYALKAFKVNSIDYLLKPLDLEELSQAFEQYEQLKARFKQASPVVGLESVQRAMQMLTQKHKSRFIVKSGHSLASVAVAEIQYFFSEHKLSWLVHQSGKKFAVDYTLEQLEELLDPERFFRLNRKYIVAIDGIKEVINYTNSRLKVLLVPHPDKEEVIVSREKASALKAWLDQ